MFSVDNFYNYLNQYLIDNKKDVDLKSFNVHGSRQLIDIIVPSYTVNTSAPKRYIGQAAMFDQEPIELEYFTDWINFDPASYTDNCDYSGDLYKNLTPEEFIFRHFSAVYNPILCHSERNSPEVALFKDNHFHAVHYFYHGLIARDWFRHWKHYSMSRGEQSKRLGMYCRDASGSRAYRLDLIKKLIPYHNDLHFEIQSPILNIEQMGLRQYFKVSDTEYSSDSSATIVPEDCQKFDIQIVPETLFNTQKTHLTEKVFKPIVMQQPFIIAGCPGSLEYLRSYGFHTFDSLWDESYDKETDSKKRMAKIMEVVEYITHLDEDTYRKKMDYAQNIAIRNQRHFFSQRFENELLGELHSNLDKAIAARNEEFESMPGGTRFMYLDKLYQDGHDIGKANRDINQKIVAYLGIHNPEMAMKIMKKYSYLVVDILRDG